MIDEKRKNHRTSLKMHVVFSPKWRGTFIGYLGNLSESGALLISSEQVMPQTNIDLHLRLLDGPREKVTVITGRIVRVEARSDLETFGYGVQFKTLRPEVAALIRNYLLFRRRAA